MFKTLTNKVPLTLVGAGAVVKWSTCSPSTLTIRVRILLKPTAFSVQFVFEKNENKQKEAGIGPFEKTTTIPAPGSAEVTQRYIGISM